MQSKYRPEIDGLRTLAVLSVIAYHAELTFNHSKFLKGGFLGVDVFFVISGFLITSIITNELQQTNKFSISHFYERRARRLLPALFIVILTSLPFAWNLLLPAQLVDFSKSILSALTFSSNFYWDLTLQEYGAESSLLKPFLHTWSLSVEEQFYIIFPFILLFSHRLFKAHTFTLLLTGLLISLLFSDRMTSQDMSFSFYMLPSRFWELLAGALLAHILFLHPTNNKYSWPYRFMPTLGLFLICISMAFIDIQSNHPGFITLLPVTGTVLIIAFGNKNEFVTKLLSTRPFVGIGLISYSLYLWHYPIFSFGRYIDSTPTWHDKTLWIVLTFVLSLASYFFVEKPFRNKKAVPRKKLITWILVTLCIIVSTTSYWAMHKGVDSRSGYLSSIFKKANRIWVTKDDQKCHSGGGGRRPAFLLNESCNFTYHKNAQYIISIGDSHAGSLSENLRLLAKANDYNFLQLTSAGCAHIKGINSNGICAQRSNGLVAYLAHFPHSIIVYNSRTPLLLEMEKFDNQEGDKEANYKPISVEHVKKQSPIRAKALITTLNELMQISEKLVIVYPVPEQGFSVRHKLFAHKASIKNKKDLPIITTSYRVFEDRVKSSYETLDKVTGDNVVKVYPEKIFCDEKSGRCMVSEQDKIYYAFDNHVSPLGSKLIIDQIAKKLTLKTHSP